MGKVGLVSVKYMVHVNIEVDGIVDKPDVIGAVFGQTEGLLGADLELRELQRSGRIGRIEVNLETRTGKTSGEIIIPSSLDKAETSIIGAAMEIIQRIGPCNSRIKVNNIEDVRVSKRRFVIGRAKELLKRMMDTIVPDSQELSDEVAYSVRIMEIQEYGKDRLPAGPAVDESDEIIIVEGRADVLNLLKHGIKNSISLNGTSVPETIIGLSKKKIVTAFVDGDRGGDLIVRELAKVAEIDYVARAPDGKEVEEITKKEIHKALRSRTSMEQAKLELGKELNHKEVRPNSYRPTTRTYSKPTEPKKVQASIQEKKLFKELLEDLIGTRGAYLLDEKLSILGKVPITELMATMRSLSSGIYAVIFDGVIDRGIAQAAENSNVKHLVAMDSRVRTGDARLSILTSSDF